MTAPFPVFALAPLALPMGGPEDAHTAIAAARDAAVQAEAGLLILPDGALGGVAEAHVLDQLAALTGLGGPALLLAAPRLHEGQQEPCVFLIEAGAVRAAPHPVAGGVAGPIAWNSPCGTIRLGVLLGAEAEIPDHAETLAETGAECLIWLHRTPFAPDAAERRLQTALARIVETHLPLLALGPTGLAGEAVFDGDSFALDADRRLVFRTDRTGQKRVGQDWMGQDRIGQNGSGQDRAGAAVVRCIALAGDRWQAPDPALAVPALPAEPAPEAALWQALCLGLRGALARARYPGVLLALSGDLADGLLAVLACDALGAARVRAVAQEAAGAALGAILGLTSPTLAAAPVEAALAEGLRPLLNGRWTEIQAEPLAARLATLALVTLAEAFGDLPLTATDAAAIARGAGAPGCFAPFKSLSPATLASLAAWRAEAGPPALETALQIAHLPSPAPPRPGQRRAAPLWPAPAGLSLHPLAPPARSGAFLSGSSPS